MLNKINVDAEILCAILHKKTNEFGINGSCICTNHTQLFRMRKRKRRGERVICQLDNNRQVHQTTQKKRRGENRSGYINANNGQLLRC